MKKYNEDEVEKIKQALQNQINIRDKEIEELKKINHLLLKTALKKANQKIEEELNNNINEIKTNSKKNEDS